MLESPSPLPEAPLFSEGSPHAPGGFADLALRGELLRALLDLGYEEPTPIQRESIPPLMEGRDLLGQAATGTGKTAAFALPILHRLAEAGGGAGGTPAGRSAQGERKGPMALVLVPTRELAIQVSEAIHRYGRELGARVLPIYGGQPIGRQLRELNRGVDVVVATPGRALDHIGRATLPLDALEVVVLDEADEMLDMGFAEEIEGILAETPAARQTVLFSATLPARISSIAARHLRDPIRIDVGRQKFQEGAGPLVRQTAYMVSRAHKAAALGRILDVEAPTAALVFCRTREEVDTLTDTLNARGYRAEALHGGFGQEHRDRVMARLRNGIADLIVATDVAARGLDIDCLTHVVNYDVPAGPDDYVHRVGRVGRAGRAGVALTLAEPREHRLLKNIERVTKQPIAVEKLPSVADLRARRLELTRSALHQALLEDDDLDRFGVVVDSLAAEFDIVEVALAAVKLVHEASSGADDAHEIPEMSARPERPSGGGGGPTYERSKPTRRLSGPVARIFVGAGRLAGVRPQDLVGAITGESRLTGRDIGAIQIADRFSVVEVGEGDAEDVIAALRGTTIKGSKPTVRRDRAQR